MPKFAANLTMLFNEVPFLDRFEQAGKAGFDAVEFLFPYASSEPLACRRARVHGGGCRGCTTAGFLGGREAGAAAPRAMACAVAGRPHQSRLRAAAGHRSGRAAVLRSPLVGGRQGPVRHLLCAVPRLAGCACPCAGPGRSRAQHLQPVQRALQPLARLGRRGRFALGAEHPADPRCARDGRQRGAGGGAGARRYRLRLPLPPGVWRRAAGPGRGLACRHRQGAGRLPGDAGQRALAV